MALQNTAKSYGTVTKTFHWLIALFIFGAIGTGVTAHNLATGDPDSLALKIQLYSVHKTLGLAIFFTALARIAWAIIQPKPGPIGGHKGAQSILAELVHWALYASLVLVPLTGWMTHAATEGFAPIKWPFGQDLPFVPNDPVVAERLANLHQFFERVMVASMLLHIAGALKHHFVDKDATLRRMWFGRADLPDVTQAKGTILPAASAGVIFLAVGTAAALQPTGHGSLDSLALEEVVSDWRVLDGSIDIAVDQFGTEVTGTFAEWTAAITFDPDAPGEVKGNVEVVIAIGSLTLGNVTPDALSADFLDAEGFPTALVTGDIVAVEEAFELRGAITIRGVELPLVMPFDLAIDGDTATAEGAVPLQRLDFNVGESIPDEATVGFGVDVSISLTATTAPLEVEPSS